MTVLEFAKAYFPSGAKPSRLSVRRNFNGFCQNLYSGDVRCETNMEPSVGSAIVRKWFLPKSGNSIIVIVE